jgi:hypothetical protein
VICLLSADWVRFNLRAALVKFNSFAQGDDGVQVAYFDVGNHCSNPRLRIR